jgi:hypothetical protein
LGVPIAGLEQGVFGFEHAAWALTEAPTTMTRKAEALMMFFIAFVVLLFCCFTSQQNNIAYIPSPYYESIGK